MKKHLFYTFLAIFAATAVITLMGITGVIVIHEKYLTPLFGALLIELVGTVIALYRGANFWESDLGETVSPAPATQIPSPTSPSPLEKKPSVSVALASVQENSDLGYDLLDYQKKLDKLEDRFHERIELRKSMSGKKAWMDGLIRKVDRSHTGEPQLTIRPTAEFEDPLVFATLSKDQESAAFSLRKGDAVRVWGVADIHGETSVSLKSASFMRV